MGVASAMQAPPETTDKTRTNRAVTAMCKLIYSFVRQEDGATAVEYAVMLALILAVVIGSITSFGANETEGWNRISNSLTSFGVGS